MSAHTRGPWRVKDKLIVGRNGSVVALVAHAILTPDESAANAELIAQAPSMLLAIRRMLLEVSDNEARRLIERFTHTHRRAK